MSRNVALAPRIRPHRRRHRIDRYLLRNSRYIMTFETIERRGPVTLSAAPLVVGAVAGRGTTRQPLRTCRVRLGSARARSPDVVRRDAR